MSLRRRTQREHCKLVLDDEGETSICSYERIGCAVGMDLVCPQLRR